MPFADLRSGRAYGGHTVPLAPTAFPTKANCEEFVFRSTGEALQRQTKIFIKASIVGPPHVRNRSIKYRRTQSREFQDWVLAVY